MKPVILKHLSLLLCLLVAACGSDPLDDKDDNTQQLSINFHDSVAAWKQGYADYTANGTDYMFNGGQVELPTPLNVPVTDGASSVKRKGYKLSSNNHSDDLFMFITRQYEGLEANRLYDFEFEVTFATNAQKNCVGIGGAPGEAVTIKAGASKTEPKSINSGNNNYLMNIDKGNQTNGGADAIALGNFANDRECGNADTSYMKKTLRSERGRFSTYTDASGKIWIIFGTDSGFEGTTTIYFIQAKIWATKR